MSLETAYKLEKAYKDALNELARLGTANTKTEVAVAYHKTIDAICSLLEEKQKQIKESEESEKVYSDTEGVKQPARR